MADGGTSIESPFARAARELATLGYHVIPIMPPGSGYAGAGKAPGEYRGGAWRGLGEWQRFRDKTPGGFETTLWARWPSANIGLVLGSAAGREHRLIAVDIDATDYDTFATIAGSLPNSPMVKRGSKGETRFYRAPATIKTASYDDTRDGRTRLADLLTGFDTRQTVVPPSAHPSGAVYAWSAGPVAPDALPLFDATDLERFEDTLRSVGWNPKARASGREVQASGGPVDHDDYWSATKAAALAELGAWVPALDLYGCRPARSGYEAVATWRGSSTGQPLEKRKRNLSIQKNGIKDFGTSETYSAIDLVMVARGVDQADATTWLREQLRMDEDGVVIDLRLRSAPAVVAEPSSRPAEAFDAVPFDGVLPDPRPWAFGRMLLHRTVTALAAPPGTGKSIWTLQLAVAFAQHLSLGPFEPISTGPVWVWNNEDDRDELNRRVLAACDVMSVDPGGLQGRLYLNSGAERPLIVAREDRRTHNVTATPDVKRVIEVIRQRNIKLLIVDPFAETFEVESENSNDAIKQVARLYREIAWEADCSVLLVAHTPKGANSDRTAGNLDSLRGGGALGGVVRSAWTMFAMSDLDGENVGVAPDARHLFLRLDAAKANMSLRTNEAVWWRKQAVVLDNATAHADADAVGVLVHHQFSTPAATAQAKAHAQLEEVCAQIVRVCLDNGAVCTGMAMSLDAVARSVADAWGELKRASITAIIKEQIAPARYHDGRRIVVEEVEAGLLTKRILYVELVAV